jgi:hypothetical protein
MNTYHRHDTHTMIGEIALIVGLCFSLYIWTVLMLAL